jgi:SAM-dependent methyltransferase
MGAMSVAREHWDRTYRASGATGVSWHEPSARVSLEIVAALAVPLDAPIVDIGGGASTLAPELVALGYAAVTVVDVSAVALEESRARLGDAATLLHEDVLAWRPGRRYGLWHDRAVLHFFTEERERRAYVESLDGALRPGGHVVIGTFAPEGPERCSGLPVRRYAPRDLEALLGDDYVLLLARHDDHVTPRGVRQRFTWTAFQRRPEGTGAASVRSSSHGAARASG